MNTKRISILIVLLLAFGLLAACGHEGHEPHAINEETDICVFCKMAIRNDEYATQLVTKDGQSLKFDDIGCMHEWKSENGTDTIGAEFVRDFHSLQWIDYNKAYYVYDSSIMTPMAYGVLSFHEQSAAQAFIDEHGTGKLMTASELANHSWEVNPDMMDMSHHHSHDAHGEMTEMDHDHTDEADHH